MKVKARTVVKVYVVWQLCKAADTFVASFGQEFIKGAFNRAMVLLDEAVNGDKS